GVWKRSVPGPFVQQRGAFVKRYESFVRGNALCQRHLVESRTGAQSSFQPFVSCDETFVSAGLVHTRSENFKFEIWSQFVFRRRGLLAKLPVGRTEHQPKRCNELSATSRCPQRIAESGWSEVEL